MNPEVSESIPISMVLHTVFCDRRTWLEVNGEATDTYQMQAGTSAHRNVDDPSTARREQTRAMEIRSGRLGINGRVDVIDSIDGGGVRLVEYKATPVRLQPRITMANKVQLALQKLCLEEAGILVQETAVRFLDHNVTVQVEVDAELVSEAEAYIVRTREILADTTAPLPLEDDRRCSRCSHIEVCLPDERQGKEVLRRIRPADPDGQVLHLTEQGSRASVKSGRVQVVKGEEKLGDVPLERVQGVVVHGNIDMSGALIRELMWRDQSIVWCSGTGRVYGWSQPADGPNGLARTQQRVIFGNGGLSIAREMISAKILNQLTMIRRNGAGNHNRELFRECADLAGDATTKEQLFGLEGEAAREYFSNFGSMLKPAVLDNYGFNWNGRIGRGASDPINILLNYSYALLTSECVRALLACGLDPHSGVLHSSNRNKPALALDLMEEFRPVIADSTVISLLNRREFPVSGFSRAGQSLRLSKNGRQSIIRAFEKRIQTEFSHPVFNYKITWRRALEVQARMVLGIIDGTQEEYRGVTIR